MDIVKRPSGGRGEYEIAGTYRALSPQDLTAHELVIDLGGVYGQLRTGIRLVVQGGKCRLRRITGGAKIQIQRQLESLLLMPKSIREEGQLVGGQPVVFQNRYVLRSIELRTVRLLQNAAVVTLGRIECDNRSAVEEIDFLERFAAIQQLHRKAAEFPPRLGELLGRHQAIVSAQQPLTAEAEDLVSQLMYWLEDISTDYNREYAEGSDVLPMLGELIQIPQLEKPPQIEAIDPQDVNLRRREAARWRQYVAARGATGAKFRRDVIRAYKSICVVCGVHWPKSDACRVPGVDAAHILPWADYDLDIVGNGLCLCKLHHWAFDQMLISVAPDGSDYRVTVTDVAIRALQQSPAALAQLKALEGVIPHDRLPEDHASWPKIQLLEKLQEDMELKV